MDQKEPAVKTLGSGDLSLGQLGRGDAPRTTTPMSSRFPEYTDSRSRSESAPTDIVTAPSSHDPVWDESQRPSSINESGTGGERTPPAASLYEGNSGIHRSGSIRSALEKRRQRGSTGGTIATTGNTIGAAIAAAHSSVANPSRSTAPRTGFAIASKKRNRDFHGYFKSVPDDDYLIEDYSCALQREILAHGRLYVSEGHICFGSNILGWVTTLVISFDEIVSVEKRSTALVFKNGLMISTLHAKHVFASFTNRDSTYDLIVKIWKLGHPSLQSSLNGIRLDETGGDKTEKIERAASEVATGPSGSATDDDEDDSEEDDDTDHDEDEIDAPVESQNTDAPLLEAPAVKAINRKVSSPAVNGALTSEKQKDTMQSTETQDFPGPATHAPTDCGDSEAHFAKVMGDDVIAAPLGKVYNMIFGPASSAYMAKFITVDQKCLDLQMESKTGLTSENKTRSYTYIKPLYASLGPKQTKCVISEQLEHLDLEKAVNVLVTSQNPDVPNGDIFSIKTKYCLNWAEGNATRVQVNCIIEWTGKSWIKGPIEKGCNEGQTQYIKDLFANLKATVSTKKGANGAAAKGKKKSKKSRAAAASSTSDAELGARSSKKSKGGLLEPLNSFLDPLVSIVRPLLTGNVVYGLLVGLLVASWFGFGINSRPRGRDLHHGSSSSRHHLYSTFPDRIAAYEDMWRREEGELWDWLDERVGMHRLGHGDARRRARSAPPPRDMDDKLRESRMDEREVREAIRVTEEKLRVLKAVVDKGAPQQP